MDHWKLTEELTARTGIIIPAYFSPKPSDEMVRELLRMTLADAPFYGPLEQVWVVVDGDARTTRLAHELQDALLAEHGRSFNLLPLAENHGKLWAIREGMGAAMAAEPPLDYFVIRDGDGDHAASDVPQLLRTADSLAEGYGHRNLIVIGARSSRHHPMGWLRGELEALLDALTIDALAYALARRGRCINLSYCRSDVPDLSSGFKVYGRDSAVLLFGEAEPRYDTLSPSDYWHFGPETVTIVEASLGDTVLAETARVTWDGQPATSFGEFRHLALYGELLAWVYARLEIPLAVAARLYDNRTPHRLLRTAAQGAELLNELRAYALNKLVAWKGRAEPVPPLPPRLPFV